MRNSAPACSMVFLPTRLKADVLECPGCSWTPEKSRLQRSLKLTTAATGTPIRCTLARTGRALSGSDDQTLKLWDTRSGEVLRSQAV